MQGAKHPCPSPGALPKSMSPAQVLDPCPSPGPLPQVQEPCPSPGPLPQSRVLTASSENMLRGQSTLLPRSASREGSLAVTKSKTWEMVQVRISGHLRGSREVTVAEQRALPFPTRCPKLWATTVTRGDCLGWKDPWPEGGTDSLGYAAWQSWDRNSRPLTLFSFSWSRSAVVGTREASEGHRGVQGGRWRPVCLGSASLALEPSSCEQRSLPRPGSGAGAWLQFSPAVWLALLSSRMGLRGPTWEPGVGPGLPVCWLDVASMNTDQALLPA